MRKAWKIELQWWRYVRKNEQIQFFHKTRTDFGHFFNILYLGGIIQNEQIQLFHKTRTDFGHFYKILWVVKFNITRYNNDISSTKAITK